MKRKLILFLAVITSLTSCSEDDEIDQSEVFVRVENISQKDFKNITIDSENRDIFRFAEINAGSASFFYKIENLQIIDRIRLVVEDEFYESDNIQDNQLSNLAPGYYSFQIDISDDLEQSIIYNFKFEDDPELE